MNRNLRILNLTSTLYEGGVQRLLCQILPRLNQSEFEIIIACIDAPGRLTAVLQECGVETFMQRVRSRFNPIDIYRLMRLIKKRDIDLVHTHMYASSIPGVLAARWAGVPVVVHVHNIHEWQRPQRIRMASYVWVQADRVLAVSRKVRETILHKCKLEPSMVTTIYNGIDIERFNEVHKDEKVRQHWGIKPQELVVGSVARMVPPKGLFDLLHATAVVQKSRSDVCLVLVGGGDLRSELEREAQRLQLRIIFTGPQQDVRPFISMFDLAVLSSHTEGFGLFLLEAMASQKPVVATQVGGIPEVMVHGETGLLVPPGKPHALAQSILELLGDNQRRQKMGLAGRHRVEKNFSLERTLTEIHRLYIEILKN